MSGATNNGSVPIAVGYGTHPGEEAKTVTATFDWSVGQFFPFSLPDGENRLLIVQAMFVDNSQNTQFAVFTMAGTGQRIVVPASSQGFFPVFLAPGNHRLTVASIEGTGITTAQFCNMPIPSNVWSV